MGRYHRFEQSSLPPRSAWEIHPIWRGIGCILAILIPMMAYVGAVVLVQKDLEQGWLPISAQLAQPVALPFLGTISFLYANLVTAVILALFGYGVAVVIYATIYRLIGPPKYTPLDSPPIKHPYRGR